MVYKKLLVKGFTLIEVLVSLVILGILSVVLFRAYVSLINISTRIYNEKQLVQKVDFVFFKLETLLNEGWMPLKDPEGLKLSSGSNFFYVKQEKNRILLSGNDQVYYLTNTGEIVINDLKVLYVTGIDNKLLGFGINVDAQIEGYNTNFWVFDVKGIFQRYFDTSFKSIVK